MKRVWLHRWKLLVMFFLIIMTYVPIIIRRLSHNYSQVAGMGSHRGFSYLLTFSHVLILSNRRLPRSEKHKNEILFPKLRVLTAGRFFTDSLMQTALSGGSLSHHVQHTHKPHRHCWDNTQRVSVSLPVIVCVLVRGYHSNLLPRRISSLKGRRASPLWQGSR